MNVRPSPTWNGWSLFIALNVVVLGSLSACGSAAQEQPPSGEVPIAATGHNVLSPAEVQAGWELLFDGESLDGWREFKKDGPSEGWAAMDGTLARLGSGGDLITVEQYANFELALEWKLEAGGNSGIFYRVTEDVDRAFESAPEMQVLDDVGHADAMSRLTAAGSNYALHPSPEGIVRPIGEWNAVLIVVNGAHVEHWLNGTRVVEYELWSPEWEALVAASKFAEWPPYGRAEVGHIGLQDHGDRAFFRNIKIKTLP